MATTTKHHGYVDLDKFAWEKVWDVLEEWRDNQNEGITTAILYDPYNEEYVCAVFWMGGNNDVICAEKKRYKREKNAYKFAEKEWGIVFQHLTVNCLQVPA